MTCLTQICYKDLIVERIAQHCRRQARPMECLLCSRADSSVFERSGLLMCKACYDAGVAADMAVARVYRFEPADHVADNIFLGPEGATIDDAWLREKGITRVLTVAAHSDHLTKHASIEYGGAPAAGGRRRQRCRRCGRVALGLR